MGSCCGSEDSSGIPSSQKGKSQKNKSQFPELANTDLSETIGTELMEKYLDIVQKIIEGGQKFTDKDFPPNASSIQRPEDDNDEDRFDDIKWLRASEIFDDPEIFKDGIDPNDIQQGALGDCYFLSALSSMAENPGRVQARFETQTTNSSGIYLVSFYINGLLTPIIIDDYLPTKRLKPCFASSRDEELWVCLLEKAWAKLYGAYARIEGGDPAFAAIHLNGSPGSTIWHDEFNSDEDIEELWVKIKKAEDQNYQMMCGTMGQGEKRLGHGMISGHAYSLIGAFLQEETGLRLLKLRNPWGSGEWTGDWCDTSDLWTDETKELVNFQEDVNDGIFHMCFDDYIKNYATTSICVTVEQDEYSHSLALFDYGRDKVNSKKFSFTLEEDVPTEDTFTISVAQQGQRLRYERAKVNKFAPSAIKIKLFHKSESRYIEGSYMRAFNNWMEVDKEVLTAGSYEVEVTIPQWNACAEQNADYKRICVDILSKQSFDLKIGENTFESE